MPGTLTRDTAEVRAGRLSALAASIADGSCTCAGEDIAAAVRAGADPALTGLPFAEAWDALLFAAWDVAGTAPWRPAAEDLAGWEPAEPEAARARLARAVAVLAGRDGGQQA